MTTQQGKYKLFAVGALGTFMATFDGSVMNVALPGIASDLGVSIDSVAWVVLSYTVTLISLMLIFGSLVQRTGYGFGYKLGYSLFVVGCGISGLATSLETLVLGRIVQASGTAMFAAVGPAMVTDVFPENERGKGIGMMVMFVSAGFMVGPPMGGFVLGIWKWPAIFYLAIPIGVAGFIMATVFFKDYRFKKVEKKLPLVSGGLMSASLVALTFGLSFVGDLPLTDIRIWGCALLSLIFLASFLLKERNQAEAMIGLSIFKNRRFMTAMVAQQTHFLPFSGIMILLPFYLEQIRGYTPQNVGGYLVVIPICMFIIAPLSGRLSDKIGIKIPTVIGTIGIALGLYTLLGFEATTGPWRIIMSLLVLGVGVGLFSSPNSSALMSSVTPELRGVTSALLATGRNIGMTIGIALSTALFDAFLTVKEGAVGYDAAFMVSYHKVIWVGIGLACLGVIVCLSRND